MVRIIGIDPGSRKTGFGIIDVHGSRCRYVTSGVIRLTDKQFPLRLKVIYESIVLLIGQHQPVAMAIEEVFFAKDPRAALKLGQARGAAMVAGVSCDLDVSEYSARAVKKSVVGTGAATKAQVQYMVQRLLLLTSAPAEDAADALAVALCHSQVLATAGHFAASVRYSRRRIKAVP